MVAASSDVTTAVGHTRVQVVAVCVDEEASFALGGEAGRSPRQESSPW